MIDLPLVDKHTGILGDVIAVQRRRFRRAERNTGGGEGKLRGDPQLRGKNLGAFRFQCPVLPYILRAG